MNTSVRVFGSVLACVAFVAMCWFVFSGSSSAEPSEPRGVAGDRSPLKPESADRVAPLRARDAPRYDRQAFRERPAEYLEAADPSRAFRPAKPDRDVPVLRVISEAYFELEPGGTERLRVRTAPESPVTFTALDGGKFANGLSTITVESNRRGNAFADFTADSGVVGPGVVLVASPEASGQIEFNFEVPFE